MNIQIYKPHQQAIGAFDGGKIVEQKPIGFPREGSEVDRVGPLFYWAWAEAKSPGLIPSHPHQAFEILTYVLNGIVDHGDSLGTKQSVGTGGVQLIQAGSGVHHSEGFPEAGTEIFQIWFEPKLKETLRKPPEYHQYNHEEFPLINKDGVSVKSVIGGEAPVTLDTKASMLDVTLTANSSYTYNLAAGNALAVVVVEGEGSVQATDLLYRDFAVVSTDEDSEVLFKATDDEALRLVIIEVPLDPGYSLYRK